MRRKKKTRKWKKRLTVSAESPHIIDFCAFIVLTNIYTYISPFLTVEDVAQPDDEDEDSDDDGE